MGNFVKIISDENVLQHFGIKGMQWGKRTGGLSTSSSPRGVGRGLTPSRQDKFDKKALSKLDNGGHLSVGANSKRQALYDQRDRKILEKRIADRQVKKDRKTNKAENKDSSSSKKNNKPLRVGMSVAAGILASNVGAMAVWKLTGNEAVTKLAAPTIGAIGGMKYYDWISN